MRNPIRLIAHFAAFLPLVAVRAQVAESWQTNVSGGTTNKVAVDSTGAIYLAGLVTFGPARLVKLDPQGAVLWVRNDPTPANDLGGAVGVEPGDAHVWMGLTPFSSGDIRMLRYDAAGQLVSSSVPWNGSGNGADALYGHEVMFDSAGKAFVVGVSWSGLPTRNDALVLSFDPSGSVRWAATVDGGTGFQDYGFSLAVDGADNVYLCGLANENTQTSTYGSMLVAKVSPAGQVLWQRLFDGAAGGKGNDIACDAAGNVVVCGISGSETEGLVVRYDTDGSLVWSRTYSIGITSGFHALALDDAGSSLVAGWQQVGIQQGAPSGNALIFKYDAIGNLAWQRIWDSPYGLGDIGYRIAVDPAGTATVGVWSYYTSSNADFGAVRYDAQGTLRWSGLLTSSEKSFVYGVVQRGDGSVVLAGATFDPGAGQYGGIAIVIDDQARPHCFGDGNSAACPCANTSAAGSATGCANSSGPGAGLVDTGIASLGADSVALTASDLLPSVSCVFLQGSAEIAAVPFGDGARCIGGMLLRMYVKSASGGVATAPQGADPTISARSAVLGDPIGSGTARHYQVHYRDPDPSFCPAPQGSTWNVSSALAITWSN